MSDLAPPDLAFLDLAFRDLAFFGRRIGQTLRLMIGAPDYGAYVARAQKTHPGRPVMTEAEFFRNRQDRRFGAARSGCVHRCC